MPTRAPKPFGEQIAFDALIIGRIIFALRHSVRCCVHQAAVAAGTPPHAASSTTAECGGAEGMPATDSSKVPASSGGSKPSGTSSAPATKPSMRVVTMVRDGVV